MCFCPARRHREAAARQAIVSRVQTMYMDLFGALGIPAQAGKDPHVVVKLGSTALKTAALLLERYDISTHVPSQPPYHGEWLLLPAWSIEEARRARHALLDVIAAEEAERSLARRQKAHFSLKTQGIGDHRLP